MKAIFITFYPPEGKSRTTQYFHWVDAMKYVVELQKNGAKYAIYEGECVIDNS